MRYAIYTYRIVLFGFGVYIHRKEVLFGGRIDRKGRPKRRAGPLLLPDGAQDKLRAEFRVDGGAGLQRHQRRPHGKIDGIPQPELFLRAVQ